MARRKTTPETEARELADAIARRIAESVPSAATYSAAIADSVFASLTEPQPDAGAESGTDSLDTH